MRLPASGLSPHVAATANLRIRGPLTDADREVYHCPVEHKTEGGMDDNNGTPVRLPVGYRLVAVASDAWLLLAPGGIRVARYLGTLDRWRVELDAREHQRRDR